MQSCYRYKIPALLLVVLLFVTSSSFGQPASSAAIDVTATVVAPIGASLCLEQGERITSKTPGLYVLCPAEAQLFITVDERDHPVHSRDLSDASASVQGDVGKAAVRVLDCSHLISSFSSDSATVVTVIFTEN